MLIYPFAKFMQACQPLRELHVPTPLVIFACAVEIVAKATA